MVAMVRLDKSNETAFPFLLEGPISSATTLSTEKNLLWANAVIIHKINARVNVSAIEATAFPIINTSISR